MEQTDDQKAEPIRGLVAAIITNHALAINRGSADGVTPGMRFAVLHESSGPLEIHDPVTGEPLGPIAYPKVLVKVVKVTNSHLSVARTYRSTGGGPRLRVAPSTFTDLLGSTPVQYESLEASDDARIDRQINQHASIVNVGDVVVEVQGDEFDGLTPFG